jgi:hypothetical protein
MSVTLILRSLLRAELPNKNRGNSHREHKEHIKSTKHMEGGGVTSRRSDFYVLYVATLTSLFWDRRSATR